MGEGSPGTPRDLLDRRPVRYGLFVAIPAVIFVLVCAGIRVSQYGINHTIVVIGQPQLLSGSHAALRVTLIADDEGFFLPDRITGHLVRGDRRHPIFDGAVSDDGYALARNFVVPEMPPGPAVLELDIEFDERKRVVRADVEIVDEPPPAQLIVPDDSDLSADTYPVVKDGVRIEALTEDRAAPTGLTSVVFFRATRDGAPAAIDLDLTLPADPSSDPEPSEHRTDKLGVLALPLKPFEMAAPIRVGGAVEERKLAEIEAADGGVDGGVVEVSSSAYLFPRVNYGGITAAIHDPIVRVDEPIRVTVMQISRGGPVYAELFKGGRWVAATSAWMGGAAAEIDIRPPETGLLRIQFSTSALAAGNTVAVRHVFVLEEGQSVEDGLRAILERVAENDGERAWAEKVGAMPLERGGYERRAAAAFSLSRLYAGHQVAPRLVSSRKEDDAELAEFKASFQSYVMTTIIVLGVGVALLIAMLTIQARRKQARLSLMLDGDLDGDEPQPEFVTDVGAKGAKAKVVLQGIVLFVILIGAFASIALLVGTLTWGR